VAMAIAVADRGTVKNHHVIEQVAVAIGRISKLLQIVGEEFQMVLLDLDALLHFFPTGGFLIGLGPFELMAEAQFRFLGGLWDVDWLVEEGLKDVNSESSRWSIPFLVGARIRF